MAWIKIEQSIKNHRKIYTLCDELDIIPAEAVGYMVMIWLWAVDNANGDGTIYNFNINNISRVAGWEGDPHEFAEALIHANFLEVSTSDESSIKIHNWNKYTGGMKTTKNNENLNNSIIDKNRLDKNRLDKNRLDKIYFAPTENQRQQNKSTEIKNNNVNMDESAIIAQVYESYKMLCPSLPPVERKTAKRNKAIIECYNFFNGDMLEIEQAFMNAEESSFLKGINGKKPNFKISFDWLMQPEHLKATAKGKYNDDE